MFELLLGFVFELILEVVFEVIFEAIWEVYFKLPAGALKRQKHVFPRQKRAFTLYF